MSTTRIHPTALVSPAAELGEGVEIGAFAYVGAGVRLGAGTRLHHHASVEGDTELGPHCEVFPFCSIGAKTQDLKYKGGQPGVRIGSHNVFREYVSVHAATADGDLTRIGSHNHILAYCHVAHDCQLGDHIIMSNSVGLAGHVVVEDYAVLGAVCGVHQFCRIGAYAMVSAYAKVVQDIAPFVIADGQPAVIRAINKVGLERRGFAGEPLERVKQLYRILFREGLNRSQALERIAAHPLAQSAEFQRMREFAAKCTRGLAQGNT
ncbi:acyl-[acyl-carrier-protein]--UDP-N-acetylglucosamine O-acyltransferase [Cephaloticoccus primus]|uniref:Acyl-[acyl-carrier-protein]--UDP-N-acetylglucosamine O-acyltransferase n=1 Tax=Cephaloticoccus primus TaxID=1548207 RepID=A0A139SKK0_9BACT|nr:acyl-ACP--UDP-N-acetylglucosamine O-acyltransferase [Cephaloticoccus primus]KXU35065.1 acyl-[acyl-carrier-protein]--UDP-N-acetylglucosamine O-acyltransferase [Cephaloticoccus primus]